MERYAVRTDRQTDRQTDIASKISTFMFLIGRTIA
jgi:hypothetical protein